MPRISSPRPLDLTKPFVTSSQDYGSQPFDLSEKLVTWYRDTQGDFVPDLSGNGNTGRASGRKIFEHVTTPVDTPEFNSKASKIRSFGFLLGSTSTTISHITTIGSNGTPVASDDHSFTDGLNDIPFSISFWLKLNSTVGTQYIIGKESSTNFEWSIFQSTGGIYVDLYYQNSNNRIRAFKNFVFQTSTWCHIVVVYDGSKSPSGIRIYKDGTELSSLGTSTLGTYSGMVKYDNVPICIGTVFANVSSYTVNTSDLEGSLHSIAIWKDRQLGGTEVGALYNAYVSGSGGTAKSGFISRSPRLHLRELDDLPGSYSTVRRSGDPTRSGALTSNFNDQTTLVFSDSNDLIFPTMLPRGSSFAYQAVDIIGQESDISASLPIRSFQQPNHLHYSPTEDVGPFDENRTTPAIDFFLSGTDPDVLPGFSSPARSKLQLTKEFTISDNFKLGVGAIARGNADNRSGVAYLNFDDSKFEYKGLADPATGGSIPFDIAANLEQEAVMLQFFYRSTGSESMVQMFVRPENQYDTPFYGDQSSEIYVGSPTIAAFAPSANKYYATASQRFRMSNWIQTPFLLEKVSIEISNVEVNRPASTLDSGLRDPGIPVPSGTPWFTYGMGSKLQDNYVFFIGRQFVGRRSGLLGYNNTSNDDAIWEVSSSVREIFATASACFYNLPSYQAFTSASGPSHYPAFSYDFNQSVSVPLVKLDPGLAVGSTVNIVFSGGGVLGPFQSANAPVGPNQYQFDPNPNQLAINLFNAITSSAGAAAVLLAAGYAPSAVGNYVYLTGDSPFSEYVSTDLSSTTNFFLGSGGSATTYTGPLSLNFYPTVSPKILNAGLRSIPNETVIAKPITLFTEKVTLQLDAWPGGLGVQDIPFYSSNYVTTASAFDYTVMAEFPTGSVASRTSGNFFSSTTTVDSPLLLNDTVIQNEASSRAHRKFGGESSNSLSLSVSSSADVLFSYQGNTEVSSISPYILMPEDELFFGVDAGISVYQNMTSFGRFDDVYMEFKENSQIKITLFGSEIKDGREHVNSLNQDLSSNSIHEIVGAEMPIDQFQIDPESSYFGSRLDEIITGSMATPISGGLLFTTTDQDNSRRVISRVSLGQAGTTGSLQRFIRISDNNERAYDSCLPDIFSFVSQSNIGLTGSVAQIGQNVNSDSLNEYLKFLPRQFPFQDNPTRFFEPDGELSTIVSNSTVSSDVIYSYKTLELASTGGPYGSSYDSDARMRDLVFRTRWKISNRYNGNGPMAHRFSDTNSAELSQRQFSSGTFRYGISNINPEFTMTRWRYDHYGYFRDMLEPRHHVTTFNGDKPVKVTFVSGSVVLSDPTDTHSQNISTFATSSLPFFDDGVARNRSDNPDESLLTV